MRPESAISLALVVLYCRTRSNEIGYRKDVLDGLKELSKRGFSTLRGITVRPTPRGPQSDEVSDFIGRLAMAGYLVQESPIRITPEGLDLLRRHLARAARDDNEIARAVDELGLREFVKEPEAAMA